MRYYIIAGEASGDLHGSNLVRAMSAGDPGACFRGWGGDKMSSAGVELEEHYKNTSFMGFVEVILHLRTILGFLRRCKADILAFRPDVLVLVDYPGFNLRIAEWAHKEGIFVVYYITPQVWAWHKSRVHILGKYTHLLLCILPFEKDFFARYGYTAHFVGHPLLDAIEGFVPSPDFTSQYTRDDECIALLPGSRKQEIRLILPIMLQAVSDINRPVLLAGAPAISDSIYMDILSRWDPEGRITLVRNQTYEILSLAHTALVGSGTATLETALFGVPQIVCYKGSAISVAIARRLVSLPFISLVNLIAGKQVVTELIQDDLTSGRLREELRMLSIRRADILADYNVLRQELGRVGASERAARLILNAVNP